MSYYNGPKITTRGLILYMDAKNTKSYIGSGASWSNMATSVNSTIPAGTAFSSSLGVESFYFSGTNSYITTDIAQNTYFTNNSDVTLMATVNMPAANYKSYLGHAQYVSHGFMLGVQSGVHKFVMNTAPSGQYAVDGPAPTTTAPEHIVGTFSGGRMSIYYNGNLYATNTGNSYVTSSVNLLVGYGNQGGWDPYIGHIYNAAVYNVCLTANEVLQNYNAVKSRFKLA